MLAFAVFASLSASGGETAARQRQNFNAGWRFHLVDANGAHLSDSPPGRLSLEAGPGELPTGRSIQFTPATYF